MKTISESIRALRRARGLTQEALAEKLGLTSQAISKWESGATLPDVSMIVTLASIFEVSADVILGISPDSQEREVKETRRYLEENDVTNRECIDCWNAIATRYPNNYTARLELGEAYEWIPDYDSAIRQYERIIEGCTDTELRAQAMCRLVGCFSLSGRSADAIKLAQSAPTISASREYMLANISDSPNYKHDRQYLLEFCAQTIPFLLMYGQDYETPDDMIRACESALTVLDTVYYDGFNDKFCAYIYVQIHYEYAKSLACAQRYDEMFAQLERCFEVTDAKESLPTGTYTYPNNIFINTTSYTLDAPSEGHEWDRLASWLENSDFDPVRNEVRFREIVEQIRARIPDGIRYRLGSE